MLKKPQIALKDSVPCADFLIGGRVVTLRACQRAHYTIEALTGLSIQEYMKTLEGEGPLHRFYPFFWGLTATHRAEGGQQHTLTDADREVGMLVPSSFVFGLPTGPAWRVLCELADQLIAAAWSDPDAPTEALPPDPTPPAESSPP